MSEPRLAELFLEVVPMHLFSLENRKAFAYSVGDLTVQAPVRRLRQFVHPRRTSRYDHALLVAYLSFVLARKWNWDSRAVARAGLLHDLFWQECDNSWSLCIHHPEMAAENAARLTYLSPKEENIILSHMWPAGRHLPRCREAWLVDMMDNVVALLDYLGVSCRWNRQVEAALMPC